MEEVDSNSGRKLTFDETLSRLEAERRLDPAIIRTVDYLEAASLIDEEKDVLLTAKQKLSNENPRELYLAFLKYCVENLKAADRAHKYKFARQINDVAIMGLGVWQEDLGLMSAGEGSLKITGEPKWDRIKDHIDNTIFGEYFVEKIDVPDDGALWGVDFPLRMSACDASQHRMKIKVPFNKTWATPVIVNNSGGTIKERNRCRENQKRTSQAILRWNSSG